MPQAKQTSKRKRRSKTLPVLGAAGLSLSLASGASAVPGGPAVNLPTSGNGDGNQVFLGEEEISDVSLATFYVFDKEGADASSMVQLVGHGCGGCHGCGGHGCHGCGGCGTWVRLPRLRRLPSRMRWLRLRQHWGRLHWLGVGWLRRVGWLRWLRRVRRPLVLAPRPQGV